MKPYKKTFSVIFAVLGWFAVTTQLVLMLDIRLMPPTETIMRFFSFFTVLTNLLTALFFTWQSLGKRELKTGTLTAITVYITIVGLVYQVLLRQLWVPTGLQKVVDELLHSVIPLLTICYWYCYEHRSDVSYKQIAGWLVFPFVYLAYILLRGCFSGFYPYPFINVSVLGFPRVMFNSFCLLILFAFISFMFVLIGRKLKKIA